MQFTKQGEERLIEQRVISLLILDKSTPCLYIIDTDMDNLT